jgi:ribonuclease BN (tRNA processing enzyme)
VWRRGLLGEIDAIVISHMHLDHVLDLLPVSGEVTRNGHLTGEQAGLVAQRDGVRRLVLTHIGPWPGQNEENLRRARARSAGEVEQASEAAAYTTLGRG